MRQCNNIFIKNIYYMLAFAFKNLNEICEKGFDAESFENAQDLFALILYKGISKQLKYKLLREYTTKKEILNSPKGKINISESLKSGSILTKQLVCEYDELTENFCFNQILKSTCLLLIKTEDVKDEYKNLLKTLMPYFEDIDVIDLHCVKWDSLVFHRNNANYRLLINLCYMIATGMIMTDTDGKYHFSLCPKEPQLWSLFENFVLEYYKKYFPECRPCRSKVKWNLTNEKNNILLPQMKTDIKLSYNNKTLIIDTKFYSKNILQKYHEKESIRSFHLYQIFTYVKNEDKNNSGAVSGLLLYAKTENLNIDLTLFDDEFCGNRINAAVVDLNNDWQDITKQLNDIVYDWKNYGN